MPGPKPSTYVGLFLTTLSLLQLELFLTRIFSVTMWYHFAFMAISLAMFGVAAGAVIVELMRKADPHRTLAKMSLLFAVSTAVCFTVDLYIPADPDLHIWWMALSFFVIAIPFVFAGIVICVALTQFPLYTGRLYAADLAGSAVGCLLTIPILNQTHAPTAVIVNAAIAALGGAIFALAVPGRLKWVAAGICVALLGVVQLNHDHGFIEVQWVKGERNPKMSLYERWNALSRILVRDQGDQPFGWGISDTYKPTYKIPQLHLDIDGAAGTVITKFDGSFEPLQHLKYDVTAMAHQLRREASVLIIGVGGGRDILTSLLFGQKRIVGVEINPDILRVLTRNFGDYAGHLEARPEVTLVNDEARSYVARSREQFGIIQASLIDTWAASSAGAYVLSENALYTKEAWLTFLSHLTPDGILTMSRWHYDPQPAESLRLTALATASLIDMGIQDPRRHIMMVRKKDPTGFASVATILVSPRPFSEADVDRVLQVSAEMQFVPVLTPRSAELPEFEAVTAPGNYDKLVRSYPSNIAAPTDDSPFFFHMLRISDLLKGATVLGANMTNMSAVRVLAALLVIVVTLGVLIIVAPQIFQERVRQSSSGRLIVYFAAIGLAFMMVEIAQLARLTVFLGHPMYGLTVVLFVLLIASSLGSLYAHRMAHWLWLLPVLLAGFIFLSPAVIRQLVSAPTPVRIAVSALLLFPTGFFMGMPFPIGIKQAQLKDGEPTAWYWAINGAFSVVSSVLAVVVALFGGITATLLVGLAAYVIAVLLLKTARPIALTANR